MCLRGYILLDTVAVNSKYFVFHFMFNILKYSCLLQKIQTPGEQICIQNSWKFGLKNEALQL